MGHALHTRYVFSITGLMENPFIGSAARYVDRVMIDVHRVLQRATHPASRPGERRYGAW
jgi:hypothetical protein